jgi:hypothetical protein
MDSSEVVFAPHRAPFLQIHAGTGQSAGSLLFRNSAILSAIRFYQRRILAQLPNLQLLLRHNLIDDFLRCTRLVTGGNER